MRKRDKIGEIMGTCQENVFHQFRESHGTRLVRLACEYIDAAERKGKTWEGTFMVLAKLRKRSRSHQIAFDMWSAFVALMDSEFSKNRMYGKPPLKSS